MGRTWEYVYEPYEEPEKAERVTWEYRPNDEDPGNGTVSILVEDGLVALKLVGLPWDKFMEGVSVMQRHRDYDAAQEPLK